MRARMRKYRDLRVGVRNLQTFNIGGGNSEIDFAIRGPELEKLAKYARDAPRAGAASSGIIDADTTLKLDKPELRARIDRARAADLGVETAGRRGRAAPDGRRRRGGHALPRSRRSARTTTSSCGSSRTTARDPDTISRLYVPRAQRRAGAARLASSRSRKAEPVARRSARSPAPGQRCAPASRRATRWRIASQALREAAAELGMPPAYTDSGQRPRPRARAHVHRVRLGVPAVDRVHVHGAGGAVREPARTRSSSCSRCRCRCRSRCCRCS